MTQKLINAVNRNSDFPTGVAMGKKYDQPDIEIRSFTGNLKPEGWGSDGLEESTACVKRRPTALCQAPEERTGGLALV